MYAWIFNFLFLAVLGLCCWVQAFSSCSKCELLFIAVYELVVAVASLVWSMDSRHTGFSRRSTWAYSLWHTGLVALRRVGSPQTSDWTRIPALAGGSLTIGSPGKSYICMYTLIHNYSWRAASLSGSDGKNTACNAGDLGSIPGSERSPGKGHGNPFQYSCLENPWTEKPGGLKSIGSHRVRNTTGAT